MLKLCYLDVSGKNGKFLFPNIDSRTLNDILAYKSWNLFDSWNGSSEKITYLNFTNTDRGVLVETKDGIGFVSVLLNHLKKLGFTVLDMNNKPFNQYDSCIKVKFPPFKFAIRNYQSSCCLKWLRDRMGIIKAPTGSGKTIMASYLMKNIGYKTLVLVHTLDLVNMWQHSFDKTFGFAFGSTVGVFGGGRDLSHVVNKNIVIGTYQSALKEGNMKQLKKAGFGFACLDECIPGDSIVYTDKGKFNLLDLKNTKDKNINIQLFDIDKQMLGYSKFDIFETKIKDVYTTMVENGKKINSSIDHRFLTKIDNTFVYKPINECKNIVTTLLEPYDMSHDCIMARLYGYLLGDGNLGKKMNAVFYGIYDDLLVIQKDLKFLNYKTSEITTRELKGHITCEDGRILEPKGTVSSLAAKSPFGNHMYYYGYPVGNKTNVNYNIPQFIKKGDIKVKKEFLAGFLGAEGSALTMRLKRSFWHTKFSYNKRKDLVKKSMEFALQIKKLFYDCGVKISDIKVMDGNKRKDGTISKKILFTVANNSESLYNYTKIGFRYCKQKEVKNAIVLNYFDYIKYEKEKRDNKYKEVITKYKGKYSRGIAYNLINLDKEIKNGNQFTLDDYDSDIVHNGQIDERKKYTIKDDFNITKGVLSEWFHPHKKEDNTEWYQCTQIPRHTMIFEEWNEKVNNDMIVLDIVSREYRNTEQCYNLTVHNENHNYLLDSMVSKNCHHCPADTFKKVVNELFVPCKLGLSATPRRLDGKDDEIFALVDSVKASVNIHSLIKDQFIVRPDFYNISWLDVEILKEVGKEQKGLAKSRKLKQLSAFSVKKYELLLKLIEKLRQTNKTFIIFADYVEAAASIETIVNKFIANNDKHFKVARVQQKMTSDERSVVFNSVGKRNNQYNGLIFAKLGSEGIDISAVDCIINLSPSKSPVTFAQRTGRAMRTARYKDHCEIYQFVLKGSMEEGWADYSFDEFGQENFIVKNYVIR